MKDYLVVRTVKSDKYRFFSCCIPKDLQSYFKYKSKIYLSINSATNKQARLICQNLNRITIELFAEIRMGMRSLTLEEIKEILRVEIRKQILWAHHESGFISRVKIVISRAEVLIEVSETGYHG